MIPLSIPLIMQPVVFDSGLAVFFVQVISDNMSCLRVS